MTNQPSKVSGNVEEMKGSVKQSVGSAVGNKSLEAEGMKDRASGESEVKAAKAQGYAKGMMDNVSGAVKNAVGKVTGNESMRAEGEAERLKGKSEKEINK